MFCCRILARAARFTMAAVVIALGVCGASSANADQHLALVIGASDYGAKRAARERDGFFVPSYLPNAAKDAELVADAFETAGVKVTLIKNPSRREMRIALEKFVQDLKDAGPDPVAFFYFAGHGAQGVPDVGRNRLPDNYLIPIGADLVDETDLPEQALGLSAISARLSRSGAAASVIILDACRDFPLPQRSRTRGGQTRGLAEAKAASGTLIAYSTAPGDVASDGQAGEGGPYARALAREIEAARNAPIEAVFRRVRVSVQEETRETQLPWENSSLTVGVTLRPEAADQPARDAAAVGDSAPGSPSQQEEPSPDSLSRQSVNGWRLTREWAIAEKCVKTFPAGELCPALTALEWSPDGRRIAVGDKYGVTHLLDPKGNTPPHPLRTSGTTVVDLSWSPDSQGLGVAQDRGLLATWRFQGEEAILDTQTIKSKTAEYLPAVPAAIASIDWRIGSGEIDYFVFGSTSAPVLAIRDPSQRSFTARALGDYSTRKASLVEWSPKDAVFAAASGIGELYLFNFNEVDPQQFSTDYVRENPEPFSDYSAYKITSSEMQYRYDQKILDIEWRPDGERIATVSATGDVSIWRSIEDSSPSVLGTIKGAFRLAWNPGDDGRIAVAHGSDVTIFNTKDRSKDENLSIDHNAIVGLDWSPDGAMLAIAHIDGVVTVWRKQQPTWWRRFGAATKP
ncbi:MAG: caspase family protein [Pseudomonadota bacterium]